MNFAQILQNNPFLSKGFNFNFGNVSFAPSYIQAGLIVLLVFILILTLASVRHHFLEWTFKGAFFGILFGILFAFLIEGFLIVGGKTALTEFLGWKNAPAPILSLIDTSRSKLINVLGLATEIPSSKALEVSPLQKFIENFQTLTPAEASRVKALICKP